MTAVLAISFPYQVVVFGDCRVTWGLGTTCLQDNLQKLYQCGPTGVIGFADDVVATKAIFKHINNQDKRKSSPLPDVRAIVEDIALLAREAYESLPSKDQVSVDFVYAAANPKASCSTSNLAFSQNTLVKMSSPNFEPIDYEHTVGIGYASKLSRGEIIKARNGLVGEIAQDFGAKVITLMFGELLANVSEDHVGSIYTVAVATARCTQWYSYSYANQIGIRIKDGKFFQFDNRTKPKRIIPLRDILDFDTDRPDVNDLYIAPFKS